LVQVCKSNISKRLLTILLAVQLIAALWLISESAWGGEVSARPPEVILGKDRTVLVRVMVEQALQSVEAKANIGRVGKIKITGPTSADIVYTPPAQKFPQLAFIRVLLFHADRSEPESMIVVIPLIGNPTLPIETEPGSQASIEVAGRVFGPQKAGSSGRVKLPTLVPPGKGTGRLILRDPLGNEAVSVFDFHLAPTISMALFTSADQAVAGSENEVIVDLACRTPRGDTPPDTKEPHISVSHGEFSSVSQVAPGHIRAVYPIPVIIEDDEVLFTAVCPVASGSRKITRKLRLIPGPPSHWQVEADPASVRANGRETSKLQFSLVDKNGNPIELRKPPAVTVNKGKLNDLRRISSNRFSVIFRAPQELSESERLLGMGTAQLKFPEIDQEEVVPRSPRHLVANPRTVSLPEGAKPKVEIKIYLFDKNAVPVPNVKISCSASNPAGAISEAGRTDYTGRTSCVYQTNGVSGEHRITIAAAGHPKLVDSFTIIQQGTRKKDKRRNLPDNVARILKKYRGNLKRLSLRIFQIPLTGGLPQSMEASARPEALIPDGKSRALISLQMFDSEGVACRGFPPNADAGRGKIKFIKRDGALYLFAYQAPADGIMEDDTIRFRAREGSAKLSMNLKLAEPIFSFTPAQLTLLPDGINTAKISFMVAGPDGTPLPQQELSISTERGRLSELSFDNGEYKFDYTTPILTEDVVDQVKITAVNNLLTRDYPIFLSGGISELLIAASTGLIVSEDGSLSQGGGLQAGYRLPVGRQPLFVGLQIDYYQSTRTETVYPSNAPALEVETTLALTPFTLFALFAHDLTKDFRWSASGGISYILAAQKMSPSGQPSSASTDFAFGWEVRTSFGYALGPGWLFADIRYLYGRISGDDAEATGSIGGYGGGFGYRTYW
jgi:hypothetical protein